EPPRALRLGPAARGARRPALVARSARADRAGAALPARGPGARHPRAQPAARAPRRPDELAPRLPARARADPARAPPPDRRTAWTAAREGHRGDRSGFAARAPDRAPPAQGALDAPQHRRRGRGAPGDAPAALRRRRPGRFHLAPARRPLARLRRAGRLLTALPQNGQNEPPTERPFWRPTSGATSRSPTQVSFCFFRVSPRMSMVSPPTCATPSMTR